MPDSKRPFAIGHRDVVGRAGFDWQEGHGLQT
jgi:hypothetical protein